MNRKIVSVLTTLLLIFLMVLLFIYSESTNSKVKAEDEAIQLVGLDYTVDTVNQFDWFTLEESYFSLDFIDSEGLQRYAIIKQEGGDIEYYNDEEIISRVDAIAITLNDNETAEIIQARLGIFESKAVWEISFKAEDSTLTYYLINAKTGQWIQTIANI